MIERVRRLGVVRRATELWQWAEQTLLVRALRHYTDLRGNRLAGAASFYGFVSLFPLLLLTAAVATLVVPRDSEDDVEKQVQEIVNENIPGLGLDVAPFFARAGTLGVIGAVVLTYTGLAWVDAVRAAVRSMWRLDDQPGNIVVRKAFDLVALIGLGALVAISWAASVVLGQLTKQLLDLLGIDGSWGTVLLRSAGLVLAIAVSAALFAYLLAGLPRIRIPVRQLALVSLAGGIGFEILRLVLVGFIVGPANRDAYATFGVPLAILAWIYIVTRLLMVLAAFSAESSERRMSGARDERSD